MNFKMLLNLQNKKNKQENHKRNSNVNNFIKK